MGNVTESDWNHRFDYATESNLSSLRSTFDTENDHQTRMVRGEWGKSFR